MFRIGEFARISQTSIVQLRYYDEIDLFKPAHIDRESGYRYYSVGQLPRLNQIIALKNLGLSLEHIKQLLDKEITNDEIRGMFKLRQAQIEDELQEQERRLREVQLRLDLLDEGKDVHDVAVVLKSVEAQPYLSIRQQFQSYDEMFDTAIQVQQVTRRIPRQGYTSVFHDVNNPDIFADWEFGIILKNASNHDVKLPDGRALLVSELPAIDEVASLVFKGTKHEAGQNYKALGLWMEANSYHADGASREVYPQLLDPRESDQMVVEIQFPVKHMNK